MQAISTLMIERRSAKLALARSHPRARLAFTSVSAMASLLMPALISIIIVLPNSAFAEIYRCTNQEGKLISADRVPVECKGQTIRIYSNSGTLKSEIAPPQSAADKQKQLKLAETQRQLELAQEELAREERYLTTHFRSENDIVTAQKRALEIVEGKKKLVVEQLELVAGLVADLSTEMSSNKRSEKESKSYQQMYQGRLDEMKRSIKKSQDQLVIYDSEIERINREYQQLLERYRVVVSNRRKS